MNLLFINCCLRGKDSRTLKLCEAFLKEAGKKYEIETVDLGKENIKPLTAEDLELREKLLNNGDLSAPMFDFANKLAAADRIIIGAPFWDLSFPAVLKCYFEHTSVCGITFCYTPTGSEGMCRAKKALYISTAGGFAGERHLGAEYVKELFKLYGITDFSSVCAEGLDIFGADVDKILESAKAELIDLAENF